MKTPKNSDCRAVVAELSKTALAELRAVQGDSLRTQEALIRFFRRGLALGLSLEQCLRLLVLEPSQAGALLRRVGYSDSEYERLVTMVRQLPLADVLAASCAEPHTLPHDTPAQSSGNSDSGGGPSSVS